MNRSRGTLVFALVAGGLTFCCLYWMDRERAREARALRLEISELRSRTVAERRPDPVPAAAVAPRAAAGGEAPSTPAVAATPALPAPIYRNEGRSTARAALQTLAWASDRGDVAAVQAMLVFDERARTKAEQFFASLPPEARGTWRTVDDMAGALITQSGMEAPFPSADVLDAVEIEELTADRARLHLRGTRRDGSEFQRTSTGWSYVITEAQVDRYLQQRAGGR